MKRNMSVLLVGAVMAFSAAFVLERHMPGNEECLQSQSETSPKTHSLGFESDVGDVAVD